MVQMILSDAFHNSRGYATPEKGRALARAHELARQTGETTMICLALVELSIYRRCRAEHQAALQVAEQLLDLSRREVPRLVPTALTQLGQTCFCRGEFVAARQHLEKLAQMRPPGDAVYLAYTWWCLGYPDQALAMDQAVLARSYELGDPLDLAWVLLETSAWYHLTRRGTRAIQDGADVLLSCTAEGKLPSLRPMVTTLLGWVHAQNGRAEEGIAEMRAGLAAWRAAGWEVRQTQMLAMLAEGYARAGRIEEGLGVLAEALEHAERTGERYYEAELYRFKGELLRQRGGAEEEAEGCFHKAIEVARRQEARSWELRATLSLARLWQRQDKCQEAHAALAAVYGWFTEGFDTPDLQEARALLAELAAEGGDARGDK
jgi:tetratricopeptide (TPR) repeat protein